MKTFRYKAGHVNIKTMTVDEVIEKLKEYPGDMPVIPTWEGVYVGLDLNSFEIEENWDAGNKGDACNVLMVDVDQ